MDSRTVRPRRAITIAAALAALGLSVGLSGCAGTVSMQPAPDAIDVACAEVVVRAPVELPRDTDGQALRVTDAQGTAAWGNPASVLLRCGVTPPGPTTAACVSINGIDWIADDSEAPIYRFTTYGRVPATEVIVDSEAVSGTSTLVDLAPVIERIPQTSECTDANDTLDEVGQTPAS